jgi:hypothetical protein
VTIRRACSQPQLLTQPALETLLRDVYAEMVNRGLTERARAIVVEEDGDAQLYQRHVGTPQVPPFTVINGDSA